jgi:hypothetical protein
VPRDTGIAHRIHRGATPNLTIPRHPLISLFAHFATCDCAIPSGASAPIMYGELFTTAWDNARPTIGGICDQTGTDLDRTDWLMIDSKAAGAASTLDTSLAAVHQYRINPAGSAYRTDVCGRSTHDRCGRDRTTPDRHGCDHAVCHRCGRARTNARAIDAVPGCAGSPSSGSISHGRFFTMARRGKRGPPGPARLWAFGPWRACDFGPGTRGGRCRSALRDPTAGYVIEYSCS